MSGRLRFEAWTLPTAGTFEKITDIPALAGSTGTRELSAYTDGSLTVAADWDGLDQIISTTVGSLIRVYDGTTLVDEFLAERLDVPVDRPSAVTISGTQINGLVEKLAVYPYNYPNDIPTAQDWVWGGPSIIPSLTLADMGSVREVWELWHDGTGGSFTLTVDGQTTTAIDYTIVSPTVIENRLQTLSTVNDVTVSGGNNSVREVIELYNGATGGSQGLDVTVDGVTETATWAYNAAAATVDTALQALTIITSTTVTGAGTVGSPWTITFNNPNNPSSVAKDDTLLTGGTSTLTSITAGETDPWTITFYDPPNPTTVTITDSLTGGNPDGATLTQITAGALDPSPITQSQFADARIDPLVHGTYTDPAIQVVETNLNTGSDWALLVNATGQFAGSQIILSVKPGHTYSNISVPVRPDSNGKYRLVIRDIYENQIAATNPYEVALTAGTYQTLTVPQFTVPDGVYQIIMRVAVVQATYADFRVDWQHATLNEGDAEATPGEIARILVENAQVERSAFAFLDIAGFTDTVDTDGTAWPSSISFTASFGQHFGHVLDGLNSLGYEWQITPKGTPSGGFTHDLDLYVPGGAGTDLTATTGGPAVMSNTVAAANVVKRIPAYTAGLAWGNDTYLEDTDATRLTNFGRWERVFDVEHLSSTASLQELLDEQFAEQATNLTATQATIRDDVTTPLVDYDVGDTIWWQFPGTLAKEARRIKRVSWAHDDLATYTLHASTVHTGDSAMAAAVNKLLNKYEKRRGGTTAQASLPSGNRAYPIIVAASDAHADMKAIADFVCDGTTDKDTINTALLLAEARQGVDVLLTGGIFYIPMTTAIGIYVPSGVSLYGMSEEYTYLEASGEYTDGSLVYVDFAQGNGIENIYIYHGGAPTADMVAVYLTGGQEQFCRHVIIKFWRGTGIIDEADNTDIAHCRIEKGGSLDLKIGVETRNGSYGGCFDVYTEVCSVAGFYTFNSSGKHWTGCSGSLNAIDFQQGAGSGDNYVTNFNHQATTSWAMDVDNMQRLVVTGGTFDSPANGIRLVDSVEMIVSGCAFKQFTSGVAIELDNTTAVIGSCSIVGFTTGIDVNTNGHADLGQISFGSNTADTATSTGGTITQFSTSTHTHTNAAGITFTAPGTLTVSTGTLRFPITSAMTITNIRAMVDTAPTGASAIFDVNLNGTTVYTTQANRPTIAVSGTDSGNTTPDVTALAAGDYLQIDIDQIGSTIAGADAVLVIEVQA